MEDRGEVCLVAKTRLEIGGNSMSAKTPATQTHHHGAGCGHIAVQHEGHVDYLRNGHLEHEVGDHVEEHLIAVTTKNPDGCTPPSAGHDKAHVHGPGCGHPAVPHGDHIDYLVDGRLHHPHGDHCDDHGPLKVV